MTLSRLFGRRSTRLVYRETWVCDGSPTVVTYRHTGSRNPARAFVWRAT